MLDKKPKILITGANGLLGSHVVSALHQQYEIHAIVRTIPQVQIDDVFYHVIDLSGDWEERYLPDAVDTIIHLAQSSHFRNFPEKALDVFYVNIESTARLLDYAQRSGVKRFIYASSGGVYGSGNVAFDENAPIVPPGQLNYYLGSKLCSEVLVQSYASLMNVIILRFFFMYGPGQKRSMLIPRLIDSVKEGKPITLQGKEGININPIHIDDAVAALSKAISLQGSYTLNIAGSEILSLREITEIISQRLKKSAVLDLKNEEPKHLVADIEAMKNLLGSPKILLVDGIGSLINENTI
jgi:nucleoside-diphosphate-sugar epimerase